MKITAAREETNFTWQLSELQDVNNDLSVPLLSKIRSLFEQHPSPLNPPIYLKKVLNGIFQLMYILKPRKTKNDSKYHKRMHFESFHFSIASLEECKT